MQSRRQLARDRRGTAIHEAGHAIVARHYGAKASAYVWYVPDCPIMRGEVHYDPTGLAPSMRQAINAAGAVAVRLWWRGVSHDDRSVYLSEGDWEAFEGLEGDDRKAALSNAFVAAADILEAEWSELIRLSRELIIRSRSEYRTPGLLPRRFG